MSRYDPARHGPVRVVGPGFHARVHDLVREVPRGAVTTYGDIAKALGLATAARHVGWALAALPAGSDVPWYRVVDGRGHVTRAGSTAAREQTQRLAAEGVRVVAGRVVDFAKLRALGRH